MGINFNIKIGNTTSKNNIEIVKKFLKSLDYTFDDLKKSSIKIHDKNIDLAIKDVSGTWNDIHRFNQTGYSASTQFPKKENYIDKNLYRKDMDNALVREEYHQDFLQDQRDEYHEYMAERCCNCYEDEDCEYEDCCK